MCVTSRIVRRHVSEISDMTNEIVSEQNKVIVNFTYIYADRRMLRFEATCSPRYFQEF